MSRAIMTDGELCALIHPRRDLPCQPPLSEREACSGLTYAGRAYVVTRGDDLGWWFLVVADGVASDDLNDNWAPLARYPLSAAGKAAALADAAMFARVLDGVQS